MKLLTSNSKLKKDGIFSFNLPSITTCPYADKCKKGCYATKGTYLFKCVEEANNLKLHLSKYPEFVEWINEDIQAMRKKPKYVRIHASGDFYSFEYLIKWVKIAKNNPEIQFYAYTKSIPLFRKLGILPDNFKVIFSYGGTHDHLIRPEYDAHCHIFPDRETLQDNGYICGNDSDLIAIQNHKVGLYFHGTHGKWDRNGFTTYKGN